MATHGAIGVAMRWQLTVREPFRLVRTVRLHFNRQGHVVGHSVGFHRPILHGPAALQRRWREANGHAVAAVAAPPRRVLNSRRLIQASKARDRPSYSASKL